VGELSGLPLLPTVLVRLLLTVLPAKRGSSLASTALASAALLPSLVGAFAASLASTAVASTGLASLEVEFSVRLAVPGSGELS